MKGPSERLKYDMRRIWECPICRHRESVGGHVTSRLCSCQEQVPAASRRFMRLVHDGPRRLIEPKPPAPLEQAAPSVATEVIVASAASVAEPIAQSLPIETTVVVNPAAEKPVDLSTNPLPRPDIS
jgi:hypothetical protein